MHVQRAVFRLAFIWLLRLSVYSMFAYYYYGILSSRFICYWTDRQLALWIRRFVHIWLLLRNFPFESVCAGFSKEEIEWKTETRAVKSFSIFGHIVFSFYDFPSIKTETKRLTIEIYRWPFNMCIIASIQRTTRFTTCQRRKWRRTKKKKNRGKKRRKKKKKKTRKKRQTQHRYLVCK